MGPKKIQRLNQEFGVESIAELKEVAEDGKIAPLSGFGAKSQQKILDGIELLARFRSRRRLDIGLMYGSLLRVEFLKLKTSKEPLGRFGKKKKVNNWRPGYRCIC